MQHGHGAPDDVKSDLDIVPMEILTSNWIIGDMASEPIGSTGPNSYLQGWIRPSRQAWLDIAQPLHDTATKHDHLVAVSTYPHEPVKATSVNCDIAPGTDVSLSKIGVAERFQSVQAVLPRGDERATSNTAIKLDGEDMLTSGKVNLATLITELEPVIQLALPDCLALFVKVCPNLWPVAIDRHKLAALVLELVANARDAMGGVGTIAILARNMGSHEPRSAAVLQADCVVLSVRSNRAGLPGATLVRIADSFFEDTGFEDDTVGLVTRVRAFAETSGGAFVLRDILGKITAADIILPRADPNGEHPWGLFAQKTAKDSHVSILLVDDDDALSSTFRNFIHLAIRS